MNNQINFSINSQEANQLSSRSLGAPESKGSSLPDGPLSMSGQAKESLVTLESLVKLEPEKSFETLRESIEEVDPKNIQPITSIPDYIEPTSCTNAIVVKTPSSLYCVEGWSLVQQALKAEESTLPCHIYHVAEVSQEELAIRKVAIRVVPQGGVDTYAERIRNVRKLSQMLSEALDNPIIYSHGGVRKGHDFTNNREDNVREVLAERLRKSVTTISKYLNHAEYLSDEPLGALAEAKAGKEFFEKVQVVKRRIIDDLIDSGTPKEEITIQASQAILQMHRDPKEIENRKIALFHGAEEAPPAQEPAPTPQVDNAEKGSLQFKHWKGAEADLSEATTSEEEIRRQGEEIAERMRGRFQDQELTLIALKEAITQDLRDIASLISMIEEEQ